MKAMVFACSFFANMVFLFSVFYSLETVTEVINKMFMLMGFYIGL